MDGCGIVLVMGSIHRVLKAEKVLHAARVPVETRVTPREISADCGMVISIGREDLARALELLAAADVAPAGVWELGSGACRMLEGVLRP